MSDVDLSKIKELYNSNAAQFGTDPKSVGWGNQEKLELRFKQLFSMIDPNQPFTMNELGCGYGAAIEYANDNSFHLTQYFGSDIGKDMIILARKKFPSQNNTFLVTDKLSVPADYSITSGIFNVPFDNDTVIWERYIQDTIRHLFDHSKRGISFNMLSTYVDYNADNLYYGDPSFFFDFCKRNLSKRVSLIHNYDLYEWTITVLK